jgi:hypothetical protein
MDAKILLSCVAAERGFPVIIGSRAFVHYQIASFPNIAALDGPLAAERMVAVLGAGEYNRNTKSKQLRSFILHFHTDEIISNGNWVNPNCDTAYFPGDLGFQSQF